MLVGMSRDLTQIRGDLSAKIFAIGFNKTATTTIHNFFRFNGFKSLHSANNWRFNLFQCFSDNGNLQDFRKLYEKYPNSIFILNTRRLDKWIKSRGKHYEFSRWSRPGKKYPDEDLYRKWIVKRQKHYKEVLEFFQKDPSRLYIINIDAPNWLNYMATTFNLELQQLHSNRLRDKKIPTDFLNLIDEKFKIAANGLNIKEEDYASPFLIRSMFRKPKIRSKFYELLELYKETTYL
jgi:hypothetical protein